LRRFSKPISNGALDLCKSIAEIKLVVVHPVCAQALLIVIIRDPHAFPSVVPECMPHYALSDL
jgi:hypothetical protein